MDRVQSVWNEGPDELAGWRGLAAAVILQAMRDAKERSAICGGHPHFQCHEKGCSRCAWAFLMSQECLDLLTIILERRCSRKRLRGILNGPIQIPDNPRKYDAAILKTSPLERGSSDPGRRLSSPVKSRRAKRKRKKG